MTMLWSRAGPRAATTGAVVVAAGTLIGLGVGLTQNPLGLAVVLVGLAVLVAMFVRIDWALYGLVFVVYLNLSDVAIEHFGAPSIAKLIFLLVLLLVLARWLLIGEVPGGTPRLIIILAATGLVTALSLFHATDPLRAVDALVTYGKNAAIAVTVTAILVHGPTLRGVVWTLVAAGLLLGGLSSYQYLAGSFDSDFAGLSTAPVEQIVGAGDSWRLAGPLGDSNYYGQILVVLVALAWDRTMHEPNRWLRPVAAAALALCLLAIVFTYSRGALAALVAMLVFYAAPRAAALARRPWRLLASLAILLAVALAAPGHYFDRVAKTLTVLPSEGGASSSSDEAIRGRFGEMAVAWHMFLDNPVLGVGAGSYSPNFAQYNLRLNLMPRNEMREAHSLYLEIAAERGILGLAVFAALAIMLTAAIMRARRQFAEIGCDDCANMAGAFGFAWLGYAVTALFLHDAYPRYFWLLVGISFALPQVAARLTAPEARGTLPQPPDGSRPRPAAIAAEAMAR